MNRSDPAVEVDYLANHERFIAPLARWHYEEWSYLRPGETLDERIERLRATCGRSEIPTVFVAMIGGELAGSAMLLPHDMDTRPNLSPWVGGVYVWPEYRRQGIGAALVRRVEDEAGKLGHPCLHLYTPGQETFYLGLGWSPMEEALYRGVRVTVMTKNIASRP